MKKVLFGLTKKEAKKRLNDYGPNEVKETRKSSVFKILIRQVKDNYIIYLLLVAAILSFSIGGEKNTTGFVILGVIFVVIATGFVQEYRAEKAIEKLKGMVNPLSIVIREGKQMSIPSRELVPGDIVVLRNGEKIPADCVIISSIDLLVNESILTGESSYIKKSPVIDEKSPKKENMIFAGSFIVNGKCTAKVIHTGMNTQFGKIADMISKTEKELPLQKKINLISKYTAIVGTIIALLTSIIMLIKIGPSYTRDIIILAIAICVSAFPEGFPVVLISTLSFGAYRMARKNVIVNRMSIIQTLGETTVICSDKTGTITKGEMTVKKVYCDGKMFEVTGVGYSDRGDFLCEKKKIDVEKEETLKLIQKASVLCNDSTISRTEEGGFQTIGNPTEIALLFMASKLGIYKEDFELERIDEVPFSSERKMMSVVVKEGNKNIVYTKGAPDYVLKKCKYLRTKRGNFRLLEKDKKKIKKVVESLSSNSYRVLAIAYKESKIGSIEKFEENLTLLGLVGMEDPPRERVREAIITCKKAGIKVKMITGDDKNTAISIAKQIGLEKGEVYTGDEVEELTDRELREIVKTATIFARVKPEHKLRIVRALKENGEVVTMTGDGVNDAPALKEAHIGVAMGINGTDVCRSIADLTLKDDNFATIVDAVKEGRTIFNNIRKFVSYQLSCNFAELSIIFFGVLLSSFFDWPIPILLALQILLMNLITADIPGITLGLNSSSSDIMEIKPRKNEKILNRDFFIVLGISGTLMAIFTLLIFYISFNILKHDEVTSRTIALLSLIVIEIGAAFNFRSFRKPTIGRSLLVNKPLFYASIISIVITIMVIYIPFLNKIFSTKPITLIDWAVASALTFIFVLIFDILKKWNLKRDFLKLV